jgi:hypothetical protein
MRSTVKEHPETAAVRRDAGLRVTALGAVLLLLLMALAACEPSAQKIAADREAVETTLQEYGRLLSRAYAYTDPQELAPVATRREMAAVENTIAVIAEKGQRLAVDQKEVVLEDLNVFQPGNAYVVTFETWEVRVVALGSEREISRDEKQQTRVRYRLKTDDAGVWKVVWRQRLEEGAPASGTAP